MKSIICPFQKLHHPPIINWMFPPYQSAGRRLLLFKAKRQLLTSLLALDFARITRFRSNAVDPHRRQMGPVFINILLSLLGRYSCSIKDNDSTGGLGHLINEHILTFSTLITRIVVFNLLLLADQNTVISKRAFNYNNLQMCSLKSKRCEKYSPTWRCGSR